MSLEDKVNELATQVGEDIKDLKSQAFDWLHYALNVKYTNENHSVSAGIVKECLYDGTTIYRHITAAKGVHGYPTEDAFYEVFDGTTLTTKIAERHT